MHSRHDTSSGMSHIRGYGYAATDSDQYIAGTYSSNALRKAAMELKISLIL
jgi:hypothetical protein